MDVFTSLLPLAEVLLYYVAFGATLYFGGHLFFRAVEAIIFVKQGGPAREEFASYGTQIDGLIKLFRIARGSSSEGNLDVEIEAKLRVEMEWFTRQMAVFDVRTPAIDPDISQNIKPWVEYLVQLDLYARHGELKRAQAFGREQKA